MRIRTNLTRVLLTAAVFTFCAGPPCEAQTAHPTGLRGGLLVPSGQTLSRGAFAIGIFGTLNKDSTNNTGLGALGLSYGLSDNIQISAVVSGY